MHKNYSVNVRDYARLKSVLGRRFNPVEREVAFRCEFKNRKREKQESAAEFGYALRRLALKAYPHVTYSALEAQIIDHFIHGLGHYELKKHVQFHHPLSLDQAIAYAMEYEAFDGSLDHVKKPFTCNEPEIERDQGMIHMRTIQKRDNSVTREEIENIIDRKLEKLKTEIKDLLTVSKASTQEPKTRSEIICNYCKGLGHIESRCYKKFPDLRPVFAKSAQTQHTLN